MRGAINVGGADIDSPDWSPIVDSLQEPFGHLLEHGRVRRTSHSRDTGGRVTDPWEQEMVYWSFGALHNITDVHPGDDFDGDGQSNWDEYRAGTFAFLDYDSFFAEDNGLTTNRRFRVSFLSVPGKAYGVRYVTALNQNLWTPSPIAISETADYQTGPVEGTGDWLSLYVPAELNSSFFRPTVESFDSYPLSATSFISAITATDNADNDPYPTSHFQSGDNGGFNFEPWMKLEGSVSSGAKFLAGSIGGSSRSWAMSGTYAVGRSLPGIAHHGLWQIRMVHDPDNTEFSGFNLKSAGLPGFDETEIIRVGMALEPIASIGKGISVSTDGGQTYTFMDCGWEDGRGDNIIYQFCWDESGGYTLVVLNTTEGITSQFTGIMPSSAVTMIGVGVFGVSSIESIQFDNLSFQTEPALTMRYAENKITLSWPSGFANYALQYSSDLGKSSGWETVREPLQSSDGINWLTLPMTNQQQFFRLSK